MTFKIYTRKGDTGTTQLIGGNRVPKHHLRIETYGTVDELNSWMGVVRDSVEDNLSRATLYEIQDRLFTIGSMLATQPGYDKMKLPELIEAENNGWKFRGLDLARRLPLAESEPCNALRRSLSCSS